MTKWISVVLGVVALVAGTVLTTLAVAGPGRPGTDVTTRPTSELRLAAASLRPATSCEDLLAQYVERGVAQVGPYGWDSGPIVMFDAMGSARSESAAGAPLPTTTRSSSTGSGTNVQEAGVDEPDLVKTDGTLLARVVDDTLTTYDVSGERPRMLGSAPLTGLSDPQLLLVGDRVVALGAATPSSVAGATLGRPRESTWVRTFDVSDPSRPTQVDSREYDGRLVTARQTGDVVRLVLASSLPSLRFVTPDPTRTEAAALRANRALVRDTTISDWLPTVTAGTDPARLVVGCSDVAVPEDDGGIGTLSVVGFRAAAPQDADTTALATSSDVAYLSPDLLVVAAAPTLGFGCCMVRPWSGAEMAPDTAIQGRPQPPDDHTRLYAFDLADTSATYVGTGRVDGRVASSWSMDEQDGVLRVAVGETDGGAANAVVLLRPDAGRLVEVGRVDGLGPGQQLRSMRWLGDTAVMVTYRQVDPFYVLDLADPTRPQVLGALHLPGWSSYLHPVGPHLILGLGQTTPNVMVDPPIPVPTPLPEPKSSVSPQPSAFSMSQAKATLFDISDLAHPRALATVAYPPGSVAQAGMQPHQVSWLPDSGTLLTVVSDGYGGRVWVSVLTVGSGSLHDRLLPVTSAGDVAGVRTVPLADGRVVLVADDGVRFLSL